MSKTIKLDNIYHLFWLISHSIISLVLLINKYFRKLIKSEKHHRKDVNKLVNQLSKLPKHMAVCINEDLLDCHKLSQLIQWCQQLGIAYVSLFSDNDLFVSCKELIQHLNHTKNGHKEVSDDTAKHRKNGCNNKQMNGNNNRLISFENIRVCVVSYEDSHQSIVKAAKHLCHQNQDIDQNDVTEYLKKTYDFPDPELLISFGSSPTLYGYPIWQIRLTEMYFIPTHLDFNFDDFYEVLIKYSKCEQRIGK